MSAAALLLALRLAAAPCEPPAGFVVPPPPAVDSVAHARLLVVVTDTIDVPVERFSEWFLHAPLERLLVGTRRIPRVTGTAPLEGRFPDEASVRLVCLADSSRAIERVLRNDPRRSLTYQVYGYTFGRARTLAYGHGRFEMEPLGARTVLRWTYAFRIRPGTALGRLGPVGRALFRRRFLDTDYRAFMERAMREIRVGAESAVVAREAGS